MTTISVREDQEYIFEQIIRLAKEQQPDAMVIAGDIYDKAVPSAEAVEIFDSFMKNLSEEMPQMPVMIISGNHDSAARLNCFRSILSRQNVYMIGTPPTTEEGGTWRAEGSSQGTASESSAGECGRRERQYRRKRDGTAGRRFRQPTECSRTKYSCFNQRIRAESGN